jgi:hypothetical protein
MDHVGNGTTTQGFFDLFTFFHNFRILTAGSKAGTSLRDAAGVDVQAIFGSDDLLHHFGISSPISEGRASTKIEKSDESISAPIDHLSRTDEHYPV